MANYFQGKGTYHVLFKSEMGLQEFLTKLDPDNVIDAKITFTLSDGSVHIANVCETLEAVLTSAEVNGEEVFEEDIKEKTTESANSVVKIAI